MNIDKLYEPLELKSRRGRGGNYSYVPWQDVADRMNKTFKGNWSSEVRSQEVVGENVVVRVRVTATDPETQMSFHQEGFGGAVNRADDEAGNPWKSAYSKALRDACKRWGIGLFLDEDAGAPAPTATTPPPVPSVPAATPATVPPSAPATPPPATQTVVEAPVPPTALVATPPASSLPVAPPMPPVPPAAPTPPPAMPADDMPMSSGSVLSNDDSGITEVQQIALEGILGMRDLNYEDLAKEAFEDKGMKYDTIPRAEDLTYEEAVVVVKFGNDKYRNK